jgi:hypothetical protein
LYVFDVYACDRTCFNPKIHNGEKNGLNDDDTLSVGSESEVSGLDLDITQEEFKKPKFESEI